MAVFPEKKMQTSIGVHRCLACSHLVKNGMGYMKSGKGPLMWNVYHRICFRRLEAEGVL